MSSEAVQTRTIDRTADKYDHEISLIDSTISKTDDSPKLTKNDSWRQLARNPTRTAVQDALSRRKYAKWGEDRYSNGGKNDEGQDTEEIARAQTSTAVAQENPQLDNSEAVDFAPQPPAQETQQTKPVKSVPKPDQEVDILYENQRGSFFCGIPLYSHSSLLNFDPAAWVTRDFKDSPVNITNAQVPDPSWVWSWRTWYVDMSYDVDEEGWQYSFSFGKQSSWHGTHPWFHSFVRRRRWLRKRVKRSDVRKDKEGTLEAAHHLNADYFTIHSKARDRSPASPSNPDAALARPASFRSSTAVREDDLEEKKEVDDIPSLMKAIKKATIDREKVDAVKRFVDNGGEELFYLGDRILEIMSNLIFQNSKRQILQYLKQAADDAQQHRDKHVLEDQPEGEKEKRRIDNLQKAAEAANKDIQGLEYWSDRKHVLQTEDEDDQDDTYEDARSVKSVVGEIRGISEKAETSKEVRIDRRLVDKGKKRETSSPRSFNDPEEPPRLGNDSILVQENDDDGH